MEKTLGVYLAIYALAVVLLIFYQIFAGNFELVSLPLPLIMLIPAGIVALGLRGKKISIILLLLGLLIVAVPVIGIFNFNPLNLATIGKALLFAPLVAGLVYFGYRRVFGKT